MPIFAITGFYAAVFALFLVPITITVGLRRDRIKIFSGDGGDEVLNRRIRAHGNFLEYVPLGLLLIALVEASGAAAPLVHALGASFLLFRLMHYGTLIVRPLAITRQISMLGTIGLFLVSGLYLLSAAFFG